MRQDDKQIKFFSNLELNLYIDQQEITKMGRKMLIYINTVNTTTFYFKRFIVTNLHFTECDKYHIDNIINKFINYIFEILFKKLTH